jgi:hypothetical protein
VITNFKKLPQAFPALLLKIILLLNPKLVCCDAISKGEMYETFKILIEHITNKRNALYARPTKSYG